MDQRPYWDDAGGRRTLTREHVVTVVRILYTGRSYRFGTRFFFHADGTPEWSYL